MITPQDRGSTPEVGFSEVGFGEVGFGGVGFGEVGFGEVGFGEVGFGEVGFGQVGFGQVGFGEVGFGEVGFGEMGENPTVTVMRWRNHNDQSAPYGNEGPGAGLVLQIVGSASPRSRAKLFMLHDVRAGCTHQLNLIID